MANGDPSQPMTDSTPLLAQEIKARADQLAVILKIPVGCYAGREAEAYQIMGHLAAMPTVRNFGARHTYGNEVLANAFRAFPPSSAETARFFGAVQALVADMQEFPG